MTTTTMRFFNTAGPIDEDMHYHIPPLARLAVEDLLLLIRQRNSTSSYTRRARRAKHRRCSPCGIN